MVENIRLQNVQTQAVLNLGMIRTPDYILNSVDWGVIQSTHHSYKYVNQIGVYVTSTSLETRPIDIVGWIVADNELQMTQRKDMLNRFFNPRQAIDLFYDDYVLRFLPNTSVRYSIVTGENNEVMCKFKVDGMCSDPLFAEQNETLIPAASTIPMFHFPLIISKTPNPPGGVVFGYRQPSLTVAIANKGAVAVGMRIEFKANATLLNPSLINVVTQEYFKINKEMQAGERIVVNTTIGEKKVQGIVGGEALNYFKYRDLQSTWLQLAVGDNIFRYDADSDIGNLEVYVYFHNKYLEVQACY